MNRHGAGSNPSISYVFLHFIPKTIPTYNCFQVSKSTPCYEYFEPYWRRHLRPFPACYFLCFVSVRQLKQQSPYSKKRMMTSAMPLKSSLTPSWVSSWQTQSNCLPAAKPWTDPPSPDTYSLIRPTLSTDNLWPWTKLNQIWRWNKTYRIGSVNGNWTKWKKIQLTAGIWVNNQLLLLYKAYQNVK